MLEWYTDSCFSVHVVRMDDRYRPVTLARFVYGYSANQKSDFKFDFSLNYKLPEIIQRHSKNRPTLIVSNFALALGLNFKKRIKMTSDISYCLSFLDKIASLIFCM